jgi:exodeoxyribonuclease VII large subunit
VWRVGELERAVGGLLGRTYGEVRVEGELSEWTRHRSGHGYFTLQDDGARLDGVIFDREARALAFVPATGDRVVVRGHLTIYPPQGRFQIRAAEIVPAGAGARWAALEVLRRRLQAEGLFDPARRRPLPAYPRVVGVVTSGSGAALADILRVARARWPGVEILLTEVEVQGPRAARLIVRAIRIQAHHGRAEVLIVGRGGGSAEDLWAFNEEPVVRAIHDCPIPVISAVGHEVDTTLADLVADLRAETPSRAAQLALPDRTEVGTRVDGLDRRLRSGVTSALAARRTRVRDFARAHGLRQPRTAVEHALQRVDELERGLRRGLAAAVERRRARVDRVEGDLRREGAAQVAAARAAVRDRGDELRRAMEARLAAPRPRLGRLEGQLCALDPNAVLARGYALCASEDGRLLVDGTEVRPGDEVRVRLHRGGLEARVTRSWGASTDPRAPRRRPPETA